MIWDFIESVFASNHITKLVLSRQNFHRLFKTWGNFSKETVLKKGAAQKLGFSTQNFVFRFQSRRKTTFILRSQSPLHLDHFCLTKGSQKTPDYSTIQLIGTPSDGILHRFNCCLFRQFKTQIWLHTELYTSMVKFQSAITEKS